MTLPVRLLNPHATLPTRAHPTDAGLDLYAAWATVIPSRQWRRVKTGIAVSIPLGHSGDIRPRSGLAAKHGVTVLNTPGTIDPGYTGELEVILINHGDDPFPVRRGDRIAQLVIVPVGMHDPVAVEALPESERGTGGFGSTGVGA